MLAAHAKNADQRTPLSIAASFGHASVLKTLIRGASVNVDDADVDGITPIHLAASEGHHEVIAALIDQGGRGTGTFQSERSLRASFTDTRVPWFLKRISLSWGEALCVGAHVNIADNHGFTALHLAVFHKHEVAVKCLLDRGASANCRTVDGKTVRDMAYGMKSSERYETRICFPMGKK